MYRIVFISLLSVCFLSLMGCNGGSSESGVLFEGQLTQGGEGSHSKNYQLRHGAGEFIEEVQICALGECSTTDGQGQWGFVAPDTFTHGPVLFEIQGHGIDATATLEVPENTDNVFVHFENQADGQVLVHHLQINGASVGPEEGDPHGQETDAAHEH